MKGKYIPLTAGLMMMVLAGCEGDSKVTIQESAAPVITTIEESSSLESGFFTERDLVQTVTLSEAMVVNLESGKNSLISEEGIYVLSGNYEETTLVVEADDEAKVQLVLDGLNIENSQWPAIYIKSGDKVFLTTQGENSLAVTENFKSDGDTNLDAVVFSRSDLVLNGTGSLTVDSARGNGITTKDDLKVTGGTIIVEADGHGLEANDSIRIADGTLQITTGEDALHSENDDDLMKGYIVIQGGDLTIDAGDDGIRGTSTVLVEGGRIDIVNSQEGIEATQVRIDDGEISIYATDDGINATGKSPMDVLIEVYGGTIDVVMADGDTDAFDSNGELYIYGGTIDIEARSSFDANGTTELVDGTVRVNGEILTELPQGRVGGGGKNHRA
ncbi:MAG: carbohydrate-binding domain-containing protein [Spirochaetales bacterium]|nr:carbohydrate-binding domain-containing protein [Spirochaetales bacterium]